MVTGIVTNITTISTGQNYVGLTLYDGNRYVGSLSLVMEANIGDKFDIAVTAIRNPVQAAEGHEMERQP